MFSRTKWLPSMLGTSSVQFRRADRIVTAASMWIAALVDVVVWFARPWSQIAVELPVVRFKKYFKIVFFLWRRDRFWSCNFWCRIVFCNSVFANRIAMAASRLVGAAAVCVILFSFAAGHRKSYCSGCIKTALVICQQVFSSLARVIFL